MKPSDGAGKLLGRALHPAGPVAAQLFGQAVNFLAQAAMLALFGASFYAPIGLALMTAGLMVFIGELGYPALIMREVAADKDWPSLWRAVGFQRMVVLIVLGTGAAVLWPVVFGADHAGWHVLLGALPGLVASAWQPSPLLYGSGRVAAAAASLYLRWTIHALAIALALLPMVRPMADWLIGLAFSAGLIAPLLFWSRFGLAARLLCPLPRLEAGGLSRAALAWWAMSMLGALNDRSLAFWIEATRGDLLAIALLAIQVLQGLSVLVAQLDRLLVPWFVARRDRLDWPERLKAVQSALFCAMLPILALLTTALVWFAPATARPALAWLLGEWALVMTGSVFTAAILVGRHEGRYGRTLSLILLLALGLQALAVWLTGRFEVMMVVRLAAVAISAERAARLAGTGLPVEGWGLLAATLGIAVLIAIGFHDGATMLAVSCAGLGLWRGRTLLNRLGEQR